MSYKNVRPVERGVCRLPKYYTYLRQGQTHTGSSKVRGEEPRIRRQSSVESVQDRTTGFQIVWHSARTSRR